MLSLVLRAYLHLLEMDVLMRLGDLESIHRRVRKSATRSVAGRSKPAVEQVCHAVDLACVFYFKRVLCLQRSAATTVLLRRYGYSAELVIGAQIMPFKSHAWVEIDGAVVNDKPYMLDIYQVLERC
jgi:hypothetical protein